MDMLTLWHFLRPPVFTGYGNGDGYGYGDGYGDGQHYGQGYGYDGNDFQPSLGATPNTNPTENINA